MRFPRHPTMRHAPWMFLLTLLPGCRKEPSVEQLAAAPPRPNGVVVVIRDTVIPAVLEVSGIAQPVQQATLSTRLAGAITAVLIQEGNAVAAGQVLARVDDREMMARREQTRAAFAEAQAVVADARVRASRFRALYADSAASRSQLDAAETGLARAEAGIRMTEASSAELEAVASYAEIRSPFAGRVTRRMVDPGDFVAPGVPVMTVEDESRLRIVSTLAPEQAAGLKVGMLIDALIERTPATAKVEGIVSAGAAMLTVNAIVDNRLRRDQAGGAATLLLPQGTRQAIVVPFAALVEQGDLTGVRVETGSGLDLRWVRLGARSGDAVEVLSGLHVGDRVWVPNVAERKP
jgi:RND family efflux transporter MFP subunit